MRLTKLTIAVLSNESLSSSAIALQIFKEVTFPNDVNSEWSCFVSNNLTEEEKQELLRNTATGGHPNTPSVT